MRDDAGFSGGMAPADARTHRPWRAWEKILVYTVALIVALGSIWLADRRVDELSGDDPRRSANQADVP